MVYNYQSLWQLWASIHCKSKNGKARFTSPGKPMTKRRRKETEIWVKKDGFNPSTKELKNKSYILEWL